MGLPLREAPPLCSLRGAPPLCSSLPVTRLLLLFVFALLAPAARGAPTSAAVSANSDAYPALKHAQNLFTVWVHPIVIPHNLFRPMEIALLKNAIPSIKIFCISTKCIEQVEEAKATFGAARISAERLVLKELTANTPLADFITHHAYYKLCMMEKYLAELASASTLALLLKTKGTFIDLSLFANENSAPIASPAFVTADTILCSREQILLAAGDHNDRGTQTTQSLPLALDNPSSSSLSLSSSTPIHALAEAFASFLPKVPDSLEFVNNSWAYTPYIVVKAAEKLKRQSPGSSSGRGGADAAVSHDLGYVIHILEDYEVPSVELHQHYATFNFDARITTTKVVNSGDEMQGFSGLQFYPFIDYLVERDAIGSFKTNHPGEKVVMFTNGWFNAPNTIFPPSEDIDPLLFSMYIGPVVRRKIKAATHNYIDRHAPMGARDTGTLQYLRNNSHTAYFSACATLLMQPLPPITTPRTKIVVVEMPKKIVEMIVPRSMWKDIVYYVQDIVTSKGARERLYRFQYSYALRRFFASARVVITARIHTALPSVGMGIPVIFPELDDRQYPGGAGGRTLGLTDFFHMVKISDNHAVGLEGFDWNNPPPNPNGAQRDRQRATFWNIIREREPLRDMAFAMGIVPFTPAPSVLKEAKERFHFVVTLNDAGFQVSMRRSVESVFRHHPNAEVWIHSSTLNPTRIDVFRESGYDIHVVPLDIEARLSRASDRSRTIKAHYSASFKAKLQSILQSQAEVSSSESSRMQALHRLLALYLYGGTVLETDVILLRALPRSLRNAAAEEGAGGIESAVLVRFLEGNAFLEQSIADLIGSFTSRATADVATGVLLKRVHSSMSSSLRGCTLADNGGNVGESVERTDCAITLLPARIFYPFTPENIQENCFSPTSGKNAHPASADSVTLRHYGSVDVKRKTSMQSLCFNILNDNSCVLCSEFI